MNIFNKQIIICIKIVLFAAFIVSCTENGVPGNQEDDNSESKEQEITYKEIKESCFTVNSDGDTITSYRRDDAGCFYTDIAIPKTIKSITITGIGNNAFEANPEQQKLTGVLIPDTITSIGEYAFAKNALTRLNIPDSVAQIGTSAFSNNQIIGHLDIPNGIEIINLSAFKDNNLTSVNIPDSVTGIGFSAFENNKLTGLTIPGKVKRIGIEAFANNHIADLTLGNQVTVIEALAFANNKLSTITIPEGVTTINYGAFQNNQLTSLIISNSVKSIGKTAFSGNSDLTRIEVNPHLKLSIDSSAFPHGFAEVFNPQTPKKAGTWEWGGKPSWTFYHFVKEACFTASDQGEITAYKRDETACFYETIVIPKEITGTEILSIGDHAFKVDVGQEKLIKGIVIPEAVTKIGDSAFENNKLARLSISDTVRTIGIRAFANNSITDLALSNQVTIIENLAFANNELSTITIPQSVTTINYGAFSGNSDLTSITIDPHPKLSIDSNAFPHGFAGVFNPQTPKKAGTWEWNGTTWTAP